MSDMPDQHLARAFYCDLITNSDIQLFRSIHPVPPDKAPATRTISYTLNIVVLPANGLGFG
jgi:hypothetical protein